MDMDLFDKKDDATKMVNDEISCEKYKYNSCPKEIIDFINQVYLQEIKDVDPGRAFFPASALSDFAEKSRTNGIKQATIHFLLVLLSTLLFLYTIINISTYGYILPNGQLNVPMSGMFALATIFIFFSFEHLHFYWYGQLRAMQLGTSTTQIIKVTIPVFLRWYITLMTIFIGASFGVLNIPMMVQGILISLAQHMAAHQQIWFKILGDFYHTYQNFTQSLDGNFIQNMIFVADIAVLFVFIISSSFAYWGFMKGYKEQMFKNEEEKDIEKKKGEYVFDRALRELGEME